MITKDLIYTEITPDEGKIFTNGTEFTDYICILSDKIDTMEWHEVSKEIYYETIKKLNASKQSLL